ncbi:MAG: hypothetical protein IAE81_22480 [Caldilineaceae bacterium]|nr:hypothetical protein [Caldilineaceae bacterium]
MTSKNTMGMNPGGAAGIRSHSAPLILINSVVADNRGEMAVHTNAPAIRTRSSLTWKGAPGTGGRTEAPTSCRCWIAMRRRAG